MKEFHLYHNAIFDIESLRNSILFYIKKFEQKYQGSYSKDVLNAITTFILNYTLYGIENIEEYLTDYEYDNEEIKPFYDEGEFTLNMLFLKKISLSEIDDELLQSLIEYGTIKDIFYVYHKQDVINVLEELLTFIAKEKNYNYNFKSDKIDNNIILERSFIYGSTNNRS